MTTKKILVVDDDYAIRTLVHRYLKTHNFQMESAESGKTALAVFEKFNPDLVILDVILPDIIGFEVCKQIKSSRPGVLVMLLTSLVTVEQQIIGLEYADAHVTKPFYLQLLEKQVQALFRLLQPPANSTEQQRLIFGELIIDPVRHQVTYDNQAVSLTALEFKLLHCLAKHPQRVWSRQELIKEVWGYDVVGDMRVVDVHIGQIRRKIEPNRSHPTLIKTERGVGYKFEPCKESWN